MTHFPTCETCRSPIISEEVVEGRDEAGIHFFHRGHEPGAEPTMYTAGAGKAREPAKNPRRGSHVRGAVRSFRGRTRKGARAHPTAVKALMAAGRAVAAVAAVAVPEVGIPIQAGRAGYKALRARKNPTPPREKWLEENLARAERNRDAGKMGEAERYIGMVLRVTGDEGPYAAKAHVILNGIEMEERNAAGPRRERSTRDMQRTSDSVRSLERAHEPPPDPGDEFWEKLTAAAQERVPGMPNVGSDLKQVWHYGLANGQKWRVADGWNATHTLDSVDEGFWETMEAFWAGRMVELGGKLVIDGNPKVSPTKRAKKNPSEGPPPIVEGAKAVALKYRDRTGQLWIHSFETDSIHPTLHVKKGLLHDKVVIAPTSVGPGGIGDS